MNETLHDGLGVQYTVLLLMLMLSAILIRITTVGMR